MEIGIEAHPRHPWPEDAKCEGRRAKQGVGRTKGGTRLKWIGEGIEEPIRVNAYGSTE